jgi:hypothetical protein
MKENPNDGKVDESTRILKGDEGRDLKKDDGSGGQNPYWPGEGLRKPGEKIKGGKDGDEGEIPVIR